MKPNPPMQNKNNNTNNGVNSGFLLGFIFGVLATLLLTTKKGREILKELIDKGMQKITDLEESHEKTKQKPEPENDYIKPSPEHPSSHAAVRRLFFRKQQKKSL